MFASPPPLVPLFRTSSQYVEVGPGDCVFPLFFQKVVEGPCSFSGLFFLIIPSLPPVPFAGSVLGPW